MLDTNVKILYDIYIYHIVFYNKEKAYMNVKVELKIANINSSLGKENDVRFYSDYDYTDDVIKQVLDESILKAGKRYKVKLEYLKDSMPNLEEMQAIVQDIFDFYERKFMTYTFQKPLSLDIRFFLHVEFMQEDGDASIYCIRISCKNLSGRTKTNNTFLETMNTLSYDKKEFFRNHLRRTLAHEIFHFLHFNHCDAIGKKYSSDIYEDILNEVFANYFCYEYVLDFLARTEGEDSSMYRIKSNDIFDWYQDKKYFGVGRKNLFPNVFTSKEIDDDRKDYMKLMDDKSTKYLVDTSKYPVSITEYAAGFFLSFYDGKQKEETGVDMPVFTQMYQEYLDGNAAKALLNLIEIKVQKYGWF